MISILFAHVISQPHLHPEDLLLAALLFILVGLGARGWVRR